MSKIQSLNNLLDMHSHKKSQQLLSTGFTALDEHLGGFYETELIIIGGRPGMGKTQLLIEIALRMSNDVPIMYYSFNQAEQLVTDRFANIVQCYTKHGIGISKERLFICSPIFSIYEEFEEECQDMIDEYNVKVVMIDYLQLMFFSKTNMYMKENEQGYFITNKLKQFALKNNICIVAAAQLNRNPVFRCGLEGKKPQLGDLCASGAIEQQADKVILIHRPAYYKMFEDERGNDISWIMELNIAKNKNGVQTSLNMQIADNNINILLGPIPLHKLK